MQDSADENIQVSVNTSQLVSITNSGEKAVYCYAFIYTVPGEARRVQIDSINVDDQLFAGQILTAHLPHPVGDYSYYLRVVYADRPLWVGAVRWRELFGPDSDVEGHPNEMPLRSLPRGWWHAKTVEVRSTEF